MNLRSKLLCGWLAIELVVLAVSIPAGANFSQNFSFSAQAYTHAVTLKAPAGMKRFLVASSVPFAVVSEGALVALNVNVTQEGNINGIPYGSRSKMPGAQSACNHPNSVQPSRIYTSEQETYSKRGTNTQKAVLIEVSYDPKAEPNISVTAMHGPDTEFIALLALPCSFSGT